VTGVEPLSGCAVFAVVARADEGVRRARDGTFRWALRDSGWDQVRELHPFLRERAGTAFEYLSSQGPIRVIISTSEAW
jgi:hypothetical protein